MTLTELLQSYHSVDVHLGRQKLQRFCCLGLILLLVSSHVVTALLFTVVACSHFVASVLCVKFHDRTSSSGSNTRLVTLASDRHGRMKAY